MRNTCRCRFPFFSRNSLCICASSQSAEMKCVYALHSSAPQSANQGNLTVLSVTSICRLSTAKALRISPALCVAPGEVSDCCAVKWSFHRNPHRFAAVRRCRRSRIIPSLVSSCAVFAAVSAVKPRPERNPKQFRFPRCRLCRQIQISRVTVK